MWELLKYAPEAHRIQMMMELPDDLHLETDRNRLKVVLSNLLANAIRYHDASKQEQFIRLYSQTTSQWFYLLVEDNGQGIAQQYQQRVFDMFFRGNHTSKGSGLGLYIVKETLEKLSGSIRVESSPGKGTTFIIGIPA